MNFNLRTYGIEDEYPKLVRDRIPEIIKEKLGVDVEKRILTDNQEFLDYLLKKMIEESVEARNSITDGNLEEELADIFEVIYTILELQKKTIEDIVVIQKEKREKRGGFNKKILMLSKARKPAN